MLPQWLVSIGKRPFMVGTNVTSLSKRFVVENDILIDLEEGRLIQYLSDKPDVVLTNSVKVIGDSAFEICRTLQNVVLPESLKCIGSSAFWDCESLKHIHLPNSILSIGENAFSFCKSLQSITLPEALIYIGEDAFDDCLSLRSIYIPQGKWEYFEKLLLENGNEKWIKKLILK